MSRELTFRPDDKPASLTEARTVLIEQFGYWSQVRNLTDIKLMAMPEINGSVVGLRDPMTSTTYPILDTGGLKKFLKVNNSAIGEFIGDLELAGRLIDYGLKKAEVPSVRLVGYNAGVTAVLPADEPYVDPLVVFDLVAQEVGNGGKCDLLAFEKQTLHMRFLADWRIERGRDQTDVLHSGLLVRYGPKLEVSPYCHRLVCSNGLMRTFHKLRPVERNEHWQEHFQNIIEVAHMEAQNCCSDLLKLDDQQVGDSQPQLVRMANQFDLPPKLIGEAVEAIPSLPPEPTMFDLVNILTAIVSKTEKPEAQQINLGDMVARLAKSERCQACGTVLCEHSEPIDLPDRSDTAEN